jgi:hypothetical protein
MRGRDQEAAALSAEIADLLIEIIDLMAVCIEKLVRELMQYESADDIRAHIPELANANRHKRRLYGEEAAK